MLTGFSTHIAYANLWHAHPLDLFRNVSHSARLQTTWFGYDCVTHAVLSITYRYSSRGCIWHHILSKTPLIRIHIQKGVFIMKFQQCWNVWWGWAHSFTCSQLCKHHEVTFNLIMVAGLLGKGCFLCKAHWHNTCQSKGEGCVMPEGVDLYLFTGKYFTYYPLGPFTWTFLNGIGHERQQNKSAKVAGTFPRKCSTFI